MKIVAIKDMSAGNDRVGDMWQETRIFDGDTPLKEVMAWVASRHTRVVLTIPEGDRNTFNQLMEDYRKGEKI